jgi:MATE family multidrug resistance protein
MTLCGGVVLATIMILLRNIWGYAYSSDKDVVTYIARMLPILAVSFFVDGLNGSLSGRKTNSMVDMFWRHLV